MARFIEVLQSANAAYSNVLVGILRYGAPAVAFLLLFRCITSMLTFRREPETWGWLRIEGGTRLPITHWENVIGRSKRSDIIINVPKVAKTHSVLTRYDDGSWSVTASDSATGILVNGEKVDSCPIESGDVITVGGVDMEFEAISGRMERKLSQRRTKGSSFGASLFNLLLLTSLQVLVCLAFLLNHGQKAPQTVLLAFLGIMAMEWLLLLFYVCIRRTSYEVETVAFFLSTMGMCAVATVVPAEALKQLLAMAGSCCIPAGGMVFAEFRAGKEDPLYCRCGRYCVFTGDPGIWQDLLRCKKLVGDRPILFAALGTEQGLLRFCRRIHNGPADQETESVPVHCLFCSVVRLPGPYERFRYGIDLLLCFFDHCVSPLR